MKSSARLAWALSTAAATFWSANAQGVTTSTGLRPSLTVSSTSGSHSATGAATPTTSSQNTDTSIVTATPSVTASLGDPLPSQAALPPVQAWCPSKIFCAGKILQTINVASPYPDSKTIVDKPTNGTASSAIAAFDAFGNNVTYGQVVDFLEDHFQGEGLELEATTLSNFPASPAAFARIPDPYVKGFTLAVHKIWNLLIRDTNESQICMGGECESSLIPLNHTFVVPGGRFREQYYWDSKFILDGLLKSELYSVANSTLHNFMDEIERFGFIPNGGRIYYLNRSQPPVFITMVLSYYNQTQDAATLSRALPIMEKELTWWQTNRSVRIKSPYTNQTRVVYHYNVNNTAPRPESYAEDYEAANGADLSTPYTDAEKGALYAELASGAESGWDYSSRWAKNPHLGDATNQTPLLRTLNVRNTTAVDLNAILYKAHIDLAKLYTFSAKSLARRVLKRADEEKASYHRDQAAMLKTAILDLFWDKDRLGFYDFNTTSNARNEQLTAAHWYPLWAGIIPNEVKSNATAAFGAFSSLNLVMRKYNGTIPATFITTGLQWDFPNAWPPHIYFALEALANVPANVSRAAIPTPQDGNSWNLLPSNHLGITQDQLPLQTTDGNNTAPAGSDINALNGTVYNGGNATEGEGWVKELQREIANRYMTSVFCSWYATGGELPGLLPRLSNETLNLTSSTDQNGHLFEKFSALDVDSAGRGGEYAVQAGFGWTNGVLLWIASEYKDVLVRPICPNITEQAISANANTPNGGVARVTVHGALFGLVAGVLTAVGMLL
ncbi:glycoside hydrolase family 37 protein [Serendipita vermifera MAFF 305830]|uniref:Trehalase n=1 Tax=Serendipita vermifera MAFF 305830 TaxID=933852 RepID=A0A0C3AJB2_SERVB|nr:glycoside hydrolase family 37 protein [Serendipita vermifera MAFF 305830]